MRSVLVTGASAPLGRRLVEALRGRKDVERVVGVEPAATSSWIDGVELVAFSADHRELFDFLVAHDVDTVIHCALAPDRGGNRAQPTEAGVIDTMRLGAAIAHEGSPVRAWVVAASSDVYPVDSQQPLLHREDATLEMRDEALAAGLVEAEEYVRDVGLRAPYLNVAILRLQQLVGEGIRSPMTALLAQRVLPELIGYDAPLQVLAIDDAVRALVHAAVYELAGVYNVASAGVCRYREALHALGRPTFPVLPLEAGPFASLARRIGVPHVPPGMLGLLRYGSALDTSKLAASGFHPEYDQAACLEALR